MSSRRPTRSSISGPEGGEGGGRIVVQGTPEQVAGAPGSYTGQFLERVLTGT